VKVGREPFDQHVRAALEQQNPDIEFDWDQILKAPIPSGDAEQWRERRRQERAARQAAAEEDESSNESSERDRRHDRSLDFGRDKHRTAGTVIDATPEELTAESSQLESSEESKPELKDDDL
jgi:hypothetical protein